MDDLLRAMSMLDVNNDTMPLVRWLANIEDGQRIASLTPQETIFVCEMACSLLYGELSKKSHDVKQAVIEQIVRVMRNK